MNRMKYTLAVFILSLLLILPGCIDDSETDDDGDYDSTRLCFDESSNTWYNSTGTTCTEQPSNDSTMNSNLTVEPGCTDSEAENFDENATEDDGSCSYEEQPPCTDSDGDGVCAEDDACDDNPDASTEDECETEDD